MIIKPSDYFNVNEVKEMSKISTNQRSQISISTNCNCVPLRFRFRCCCWLAATFLNDSFFFRSQPHVPPQFGMFRIITDKFDFDVFVLFKPLIFTFSEAIEIILLFLFTHSKDVQYNQRVNKFPFQDMIYHTICNGTRKVFAPRSGLAARQTVA